MAHPIHPLGTKVVVLEPASTRESWALHGLDGFYIGPSLDHYQCFRIYVIITNDFRTTDSLSWHPRKLYLPGSSKEELIYAKADEILQILKNRPTYPPNGTLSQLSTDLHAILASGRFTPTEQRVFPSSIDPLPTDLTSSSASLPGPSHPTDSRARQRRQDARALKLPKDQYTVLDRKSCSKKNLLYFGYLGQGFTDTDDRLHFQITKIVTLLSSNAHHPTPFYRYFDTNKFKSAPTLESDYEHTPCSEFVKIRRHSKASYSPAFINWTWIAQVHTPHFTLLCLTLF